MGTLIFLTHAPLPFLPLAQPAQVLPLTLTVCRRPTHSSALPEGPLCFAQICIYSSEYRVRPKGGALMKGRCDGRANALVSTGMGITVLFRKAVNLLPTEKARKAGDAVGLDAA
ncbi:hypothetical protein BJV77DRAFT_974431 [Russula vinacea]|nr:hypothetical protein BJV77DRAFT_974431 [Russula vinacea]